MSKKLTKQEIIDSPWVVGFSDGSGVRGNKFGLEHGAWILVKNEKWDSDNPRDWCDVVTGGRSDMETSAGVSHQEVAEHIVRIHNEELIERLRRKNYHLQKRIDTMEAINAVDKKFKKGEK